MAQRWYQQRGHAGALSRINGGSACTASATPAAISVSVVRARSITGVGLDDERGAVEVAVPGVSAAVGVVEVHGDGGAGDEAVRVVARPALLDHGAAHLGARVVEVLRQDLVRRRRLGDAPRLLRRRDADDTACEAKSAGKVR